MTMNKTRRLIRQSARVSRLRTAGEPRLLYTHWRIKRSAGTVACPPTPKLIAGAIRIWLGRTSQPASKYGSVLVAFYAECNIQSRFTTDRRYRTMHNLIPPRSSRTLYMIDPRYLLYEQTRVPYEVSAQISLVTFLAGQSSMPSRLPAALIPVRSHHIMSSNDTG